MKFDRSMALKRSSMNDALINKLASNISLLAYILFAFDEMNVGVTPKQKEFINSLCVWLSNNATMSPKQLQSAINVCLQFRARTDALIDEYEEKSAIVSVEADDAHDENNEPLPMDE
jgi:hypothetical protein